MNLFFSTTLTEAVMSLDEGNGGKDDTVVAQSFNRYCCGDARTVSVALCVITEDLYDASNEQMQVLGTAKLLAIPTFSRCEARLAVFRNNVCVPLVNLS